MVFPFVKEQRVENDMLSRNAIIMSHRIAVYAISCILIGGLSIFRKPKVYEKGATKRLDQNALTRIRCGVCKTKLVTHLP